MRVLLLLQTVPSVTFGDAEREALTKRIQVMSAVDLAGILWRGTAWVLLLPCLCLLLPLLFLLSTCDLPCYAGQDQKAALQVVARPDPAHCCQA